MITSPSDLPSGLLYHYTNFSGLQGILQSRKLWATDVKYLNDSQEIKYGLQEMQSLLSEMAENLDEPTEEEATKCPEFFSDEGPDHENPYYLGPRKYALRAAAQSLAEILHDDVESWLPQYWLMGNAYVTCFTTESDSLGQWRGYAEGGGFALAFYKEKLAELEFEFWDYANGDPGPGNTKEWLKAPATPPWKVVYGDEERETVSRKCIDTLKNLQTETDNIVQYFDFISRVTNAILVMSATIKESSFSAENEFRLIASANGFTYNQKFRSGPDSVGGIVPYIELPYPRDAVAAIIVGPGQHSNLRKRAIHQLLHSLNFSDVHVVTSTTSFRP